MNETIDPLGKGGSEGRFIQHHSTTPRKTRQAIDDRELFTARIVTGRKIDNEVANVRIAKRIAFQNLAFVLNVNHRAGRYFLSDHSSNLPDYSVNFDFMAGNDLVNPDALNSTIEFLTAMVTPALLISATGSLVLSTSTRLGRVVDRVRALEDRLSELIYLERKDEVPLYDKRVEVIVDLLDKVTSRSRILQRALQTFYYGVGMFTLTSVTIAIAAFFNTYRWVPIPIGIVGIMFLFWGSFLMLRETRMATATINAEMDFTWELAREVAPREVAIKYKPTGKRGGMQLAKIKDGRRKVPDTFPGD